MQSLKQLLLVEDDRSIARALALALRHDYVVTTIASGEAAVAKLGRKHYDIIVLDLNLPDISGRTVCRQLRQQGINIPILILTGESEVLTKINLLDDGANDYLTKPFSLGELKARLRVWTRPTKQQAARLTCLTAGSLSLNRETHMVSREGASIKLRRKEFALLECLMEHAGTVVTRGVLTQYAWSGDEDPWTNTVDVHVKYLRDKIDRPFGHALIQTVHGLGYRLAPEPAPQTEEQ